MAEYTSDCLNIGKTKTVDPEVFLKLPVPLEIMRRPSRRTEMRTRAHKEVIDKMSSMLSQNSENTDEGNKLRYEMDVSFKLEHRRRIANEFVASNRHCSQLEKIWIDRGLPVDRESLQSAAASKDDIVMYSLDDYPPSPSKWGEASDEIKSKAERLNKEFFDFLDEKKLEVARSEITGLLASKTPELNNNLPSCSSNVQQPGTSTNRVENVCRDMRNIPPRPMIRTQEGPHGSSYSSMDSNRISVPEDGTQNLDGDPAQSSGHRIRHLVAEIMRHSFYWRQRPSNASLHLQQSRQRVLLDRIRSRLNMVNSRRGGEREQALKE